MWVVAKVKKKELHTFKKELSEKLGIEVKYYNPKIIHHKYFKNKIKKIEKLVLENYVFCFHEKFKQNECLNKCRFFKGLEYFLQGHFQNQNEIVNFINYCKSYENKDGYLTAAFFKTMIVKKAQFISGPFTNMIFEIISKQKNKLKILLGNVVTTISDKENYLYRPI